MSEEFDEQDLDVPCRKSKDAEHSNYVNQILWTRNENADTGETGSYKNVTEKEEMETERDISIQSNQAT